MKILIAEDDFTSRRMLENLMSKWDYEYVSAQNGDEAWQILQKENPPRLAILDWVMSGKDGAAVCRAVRGRIRPDWDRYQYIILLTSKDSRGDIVSGLEAGADDYIIKPFDPNELKMRLKVGIRILELQDALRYHATHDPLTNILNRGAIMARLRSEMSRAVRERSHLCVALLDIDNFKKINDTHGHSVGDLVLCEIVQRIRSAMRDYDVVGRYGGEEFLVVVPGADSESAVKVFDRIRRKVGEEEMEISGARLSITASLGVSVFEKQMDIDELTRFADMALYRAKKKGRNRVEYAIGADR